MKLTLDPYNLHLLALLELLVVEDSLTSPSAVDGLKLEGQYQYNLLFPFLQVVGSNLERLEIHIPASARVS